MITDFFQSTDMLALAAIPTAFHKSADNGLRARAEKLALLIDGSWQRVFHLLVQRTLQVNTA
jgi:hypothetical protein